MKTTPMELSRRLVVGEMLARRARVTPKREAFVFGKDRCTFEQFNERVNRLAEGFLQNGVEKGDKVALLLMNSLEFIECYFALSKLGSVTVPLNVRLSSNELVYQIKQSDSKLLVFGTEFEEKVLTIRQQLSSLGCFVSVGGGAAKHTVQYEDLIQVHSSSEPLIDVNEDDPCIIIFTAGTTGKPKGAVLTHKNQVVNAMNTLIELTVEKEIRWLCIPPLFHIAALAVAQWVLLAGGCAVIMPGFNPNEIPGIIQDEKITHILLVPSMWISLLEVYGEGEWDTSSLKVAFTGASIMPLSLRKRIIKIAPQIQLIDIFGQTEMSPSTCMLKHDDGLKKPESVGQRMVNVEARIVDANENDVPVGEVGEIIYRGPTMMKEYYKAPEATAEAMRDGWFHSGDLVREDEDGFITIVDRLKDMIISGGENIYSAEVEAVILGHPKIREAAVVGVPDPQWGESIKAYVVPKPGEMVTATEIISYCQENIASYKKPKSVEVIEELPKNSAGKVLKYVLKGKT